MAAWNQAGSAACSETMMAELQVWIDQRPVYG